MKVFLPPIAIGIIFFFLFVSPNFSYGKNTLSPGYVITLDNDTLQGFIDYGKWKMNPKQILFKETIVGKGSCYAPLSISGFRVAGNVYRSAIVKINQSPYKTSDLTLSPEPQFIIDTVFLQAIILGEKELFYLKGSKGRERFYIKQGTEYVWLVHKKYMERKNGKNIMVANNKYIGQLLLYLQNCRLINPVLSKTSYNCKSLLKAFYHYYDCLNLKATYHVNEEKRKLYFWMK